jgi:tRNA nucleotidyltransferase (CCA-adding enzyme)
VERHEGPPVHVRTHAEGFFDAYATNTTGSEVEDGDGGDGDGDEDGTGESDGRRGDGEGVYGPFIHEDRYVVERPREWTDARALLENDALFDVALGKHVETTLREEGYEVLVGDRVSALAEEFGGELARYFAPRP